MEGWKFSVVIAFLLAVCAANAADPCSDFTCPYNNYNRFPTPKTECGFCCCNFTTGPATYMPCGFNSKYDPSTDECVPSDICPRCSRDKCPACYTGMDFPMTDPDDKCKYCLCAKDGTMKIGKCPCGFSFNNVTHACDIPDAGCPCAACDGITCPAGMAPGDEVRYPNVADKCSFCCCRDGWKVPQVRTCPFKESYDPSLNDCVKVDGQCDAPSPPPSPPPPPPPPPPPASGGCSGVPCPDDPTGVPLYADPDDSQFFCQCDWGGNVHQMPCGPGTTFSEARQVCI